ncbi:hypothetical protein V525_18530 [Gordonia alkanivorans CGMCC 6845]|uniref:Uncharacterized protein n=1 Tax=Gordonia alkanivorans CGMCC 6845 TaxID=1423140 RepID=W9DGP3_9ACTN|nr:hypothetical protein V525_18530 [Gordonia alkanivorans CGMCC 6845]
MATSAVPTTFCDDGSMLRNTFDHGSPAPRGRKRPLQDVAWARELFGRAER